MAFLYRLLAKTVAEERMEESAEDMTAAESVPMPTTAMAGGHRYCSASGRMKLYCSASSGRVPGYAVMFQSASGISECTTRCGQT